VLTGIQTAIENQVLTVDLTDFQAALTTAINGVQTAIENQETGCTVDFTELELILTGIQTAIEKLSEEDMQIINNMCCCGSGSGTNTNPKIDNMPPEDAPEDPLPPLPDIPQPSPAPNFTQYMCNMSHTLVVNYRGWLMNISTLVETGEANYWRINNVLTAVIGTAFSVVALPWVAYYFLVTFLLQRVTDNAAGRFGAAIDQHYDELVCALYSGDGLEDKRARFRAVIDSMALSWADRYWMKLVEQSIPYEVLYTEDWANKVFEPEFQARECCGQTTDSPIFPWEDEPLGYRWIYPSVNDFESSNYNYNFCSGGGTVAVQSDGTLKFQSDDPPSGCMAIEYGWPNIDLQGGVLCGCEIRILNGTWSSAYFADPALSIQNLTWGVNDSVLSDMPFSIFLGTTAAPADDSSFANNYLYYGLRSGGALPVIRMRNNNTGLAIFYIAVRFLVTI
jgi:hypothetical protein